MRPVELTLPTPLASAPEAAPAPFVPAEALPTLCRHAGIELGRGLAMLCVVMAHVPPPDHISAWLRPLAEFSVPYFFVVSGYFLAAQRVGSGAPPEILPRARRLVRRVSCLYALWFLIYALVPLDWLTPLRRGELGAAFLATLRHTASALREAPFARLFDGPPGGFHLWFLPALVSGVALLALAVRTGRLRAFGLVALGLFALGLAGGRYVDTPLGLHLGIVTRDGPFQSTLLVGLGYALATRALPGRVSLRCGLLVLALGFGLLGAESLWLRATTGAVPDAYSAAAPFLGAGAFLCFCGLPRVSVRSERLFHALGATTLGVYLVHVLLRVPLASVFGALGLYPADGTTPAWGFVALFVVSVGVVVAAGALLGRARRRWAYAPA